jgi:hypothetical protein
MSKFSYPTNLWIQKGERNFLTFIVVAFILAMFATPYPQIGMWVGFVFAAYAAVANDSIQTLGTFIASNQEKKWWVLWIFIGGIFLATVGYSWFVFDGDVSHGRLMAKGFEKSPTDFHFLQIACSYILIDSYAFKNACVNDIHSIDIICCCSCCSRQGACKEYEWICIGLFYGFHYFHAYISMGKKEIYW